MKNPNHFLSEEIIGIHSDWPKACIDGYWCPARPLGISGIMRRFRFAWMVFTGRADIITWYKQ